MRVITYEEFVSMVRKEGVKAVAEYEALISKRQDLLRKMAKIQREIDALNGLIKYHEEEI